MFWQVLLTGAGYTAGDILDLNDAEEAARIAALVPLVQVPRPLPQPAAKPVVPEPLPPAPKAQPVKRHGG